MKTKNIIVKYLSFTDAKESNNTKNYPHSGLFVVSINGDTQFSDLRMVDKSLPTTQMVVPECVFNNMVHEIEANEVLPVIEQKTESGMSDNDFILEFSKILLSKK